MILARRRQNAGINDMEQTREHLKRDGGVVSPRGSRLTANG